MFKKKIHKTYVCPSIRSCIHSLTEQNGFNREECSLSFLQYKESNFRSTFHENLTHFLLPRVYAKADFHEANNSPLFDWLEKLILERYISLRRKVGMISTFRREIFRFRELFSSWKSAFMHRK